MTLTAATLTRSRIAGVVACVPEQTVTNDGASNLFGEGTAQVVKMTGVHARHVAPDGVTTADLCTHAAERLLDKGGFEKDSVDALIFVSQTPDYRLPATACHLQQRLALRTGIAAFDVNLGCSGYPYGLWLAAMMVETGAATRVLLLVGDTVSKIVDPSDRATALLFGDCGTATLVVRAESANPMSFVMGSDGSGWDKLIVPSGAFRSASVPAASAVAADRLFMDGGEIFSFTLKAVPKLAEALYAESGQSADNFDFVLFHQANEFMISHLRKKMKLSPEKVPVNIGRFGNTSSATIPLLIATDLADPISNGPQRVAMLGFGVGFSWAACSATLGNLSVNELVVL